MESLTYVPDYQNKNALINWSLKIFGYPVYIRRLEARLIFQMLGDVHRALILDLGCGDGFLSLALTKKRARVIGLDVSREKIQLAQWRAQIMGLTNRISFIIADAQNLPFCSEAFDSVVSNCVIEHIPDDEQVLREVKRCLKSSGLFVLTVPNEEGKSIIPLMKFWLKVPLSLRKLFAPEHLHREFASFEEARWYMKRERFKEFRNYRLSDIIAKLQKAGFQVLDFDYNLKFFGAMVHDIVFGFKFLFLNIGTALIFPAAYPFSLLDCLLPKDVTGEEIAVSAQKK